MFELVSSSEETTPVVENPTPSEVETPEKETTPESEPEVVTPETETPKEENLMELPDGRKVTPAEFQKQWKEHFYPEFTRKSQKLAEYEKGNPPKSDITKPEDKNEPWKDPNYEPKTYAEIIEIATREAEARIAQKYEAEASARKELEDRVTRDIEEIKKLDPNLDESKLFAHANKYGFTDLKLAYSNFADVQKMLTSKEQQVIQNVKKRETPVAGKNTPATNISSDEIDRSSINRFESASDYLRSIKGN